MHRSHEAASAATIALLLGVLLLPAASAPAADDGSTPRVVVSASRLEQPAGQVGSSVTVITEEEIERHQDRSVVESLRRVPGVTVRREGGRPGARASVFIRGAESDQTLVLVNGVKVQDPSAPNREPFLEHLTTENVERIEVLRGPQSTLYGSEAIGGVINIVTKEGDGPPRLTGSFEAGSFDTYEETAALRGSTGPFQYSVSGSRTDTHGITADASDDEEDGYGSTSLSGRFGFEPEGPFGFDGSLQYIDADTEVDSGADFHVSDTESVQLLASAAPSLTLLDGLWEQTLRYWVHDVDRRNDAVPGFVGPSHLEGRIWGLDWKNEIRPHPNVTLVGGGEYEKETVSFERSLGAVNIDEETDRLAGYADLQLSAFERLYWTGGLRVEDSDQTGTETTWRSTAAFRIHETNTTLRGSLGTGFKEPSLGQLFGSFGANPDLEPEESFGLDAGVEQRLWGERAVLSATYFYNDIENMIVAAAVPPFLNENIESAETQGMEVGVSLDPLDWLSANASYTYTDTEANEAASFGVEEGGPLLRRPEHEVDANVTAFFWDDRGSATLSLLHVGDRLDVGSTGAEENDDYTVVDLKGSFQLTERVEAFGRLENLLDADYQDVLTFESPGFSAFAGVRVRFP